VNVTASLTATTATSHGSTPSEGTAPAIRQHDGTELLG
jgi:hypothetical protein